MLMDSDIGKDDYDSDDADPLEGPVKSVAYPSPKIWGMSAGAGVKTVGRQRRRVEPQPGDDPQTRTRGRAGLWSPGVCGVSPGRWLTAARPGADLYVVLGMSTPSAVFSRTPWREKPTCT